MMVAMRPAMESSVVLSRKEAIERDMLDSAAVPDKVSYRDAGVDIDAQDEALREVRRIARGTFTPSVVSDIGSFGGLFRAHFSRIRQPILLSSTHGAGAK